MSPPKRIVTKQQTTTAIDIDDESSLSVSKDSHDRNIGSSRRSKRSDKSESVSSV
jgi:hypothetical protein